MAGLVIASLFLLGVQPFLDYPRALTYARSGATDIHVRPEVMPNLRGLFLSSGGDHLPAWLAAIVIAGLSITVIVIAAQSGHKLTEKTGPGKFKLCFSLLVTSAILISYYGYMHDTTPLLLPMLLVCNWLVQKRIGSMNQKLLAATILLLIAFPALSLSNQALYGGVTLAFFVLLSIELHRLKSAATVEPADAIARV
jgi:hypothetical protein